MFVKIIEYLKHFIANLILFQGKDSSAWIGNWLMSGTRMFPTSQCIVTVGENEHVKKN